MEQLLDKIYVAALLPEGWKTVLNQISDRFDAKGGVLFTSSLDNVRWLGAGDSEQTFADFVAQGWAAKNDRVPRLLQMRYPGFVTDFDVYTAEEVAARKMYTEFLIPRGFIAATATAIQGATDDMLILSIEGHKSDEAARAAIPFMDSLRPHLARSAMLASQMHLERARAAVAALEMIGAPAAFVTDAGRLVSCNQPFQRILGREVVDRKNYLQFSDERTDELVKTAIGRMRTDRSGRSVPLPSTDTRGRGVLHILPICGNARDIFANGGAILVVAGLSDVKSLGRDLLQGLFDLTPAEARLARALFEGLTPGQAARRFSVSQSTIRTQMKALFHKTGQTRQADLVRMLCSFVIPAA